jgi:hypothetical protein
MPCELTYTTYAWRAGEDDLEEAPAVFRSTRKIHGELPERGTLTSITAISHQRATQLSPARCLAHINEPTNSALPECEHSLWRFDLQLAQERNRWHPREFSHK